jgi:hypothetical protein
MTELASFVSPHAGKVKSDAARLLSHRFPLHSSELEEIVEIAPLAPFSALPGPPQNFNARESRWTFLCSKISA